MPATDLPLLIDAARAAGDVALRYADGTAEVWEKPGGLGPVTEADLAVNQLLETKLQAARPSYGWLSEETEDTRERLDRKRVFIIDPIDGTRSFIEGSKTWAHSIAVADAGEVTAAVIYLPKLDKLYSAGEGMGACLNDEPLNASTAKALNGATVLAARPVLEPKHWRASVPKIERVYRPSLAYRTALVAEGRFDAMLTLRRTWEWDVAAGDLILREAGAAITDRQGASLRFNNPNPLLSGVVAANQTLHTKLIRALAT